MPRTRAARGRPTTKAGSIDRAAMPRTRGRPVQLRQAL